MPISPPPLSQNRRRTHVNSLITEVTVKPSDGDDTEFELDLFLRPTIDIVSFLLIVILVKNGLKLIHRWKNSCHGIFPLRHKTGAIVETSINGNCCNQFISG